MSQERIAPGLLLAMPQLVDSNFYRSVVLMIEHTEQGSMGVVVNRPTSTTIAEVMRQLEIGWRGDPEALVFFGGPVEPRSGWLLHDLASPSEPEGTIQLAPGLAVSTSSDLLSQLAGHPPERMRLLLGYAGWEPGQLERELADGAWVLAEASAELVFATPHEEMWEAALHQLHIDPTSLFPASGIH
jgi:putative transcriptional regulator